jgi:hypothetical protein
MGRACLDTVYLSPGKQEIDFKVHDDCGGGRTGFVQFQANSRCIGMIVYLACRMWFFVIILWLLHATPTHSIKFKQS